jgi:glycerol-3-phosphate dehydrogenase (NAD(P)+)
MKKIAVIGAGSWGTALSMVIADNGFQVSLLARREEQVEEINEKRTNSKYLPGIVLPDLISATTSHEEAVADTNHVVLVTPTKHLRQMLASLNPYLAKEHLLIHAIKGLEPNTHKRISQMIEEEVPEEKRSGIVVLSGPSHAEEVSGRSPTTVVVAAENLAQAEAVQDLLINTYFRVYTNTDLIGVELGGALKNIIALGAGLSDGLGFGDNAKAALMTRGLTEIGRLGIQLGANPLTFAGLAGVGDLIVTCTSKHSRNWRCGYAIGQGKTLEQVLEQMGMAVEGVSTTQAAYQLAQAVSVEMPITNVIYEVLFEGKSPKQGVEDLMGRVRTHELEPDSVSDVRL